MPRFSRASKERLSSCHPDLQRLMEVVIDHYDIIVLEGYRNRRRQNALYEEGMSQVKWPHSKHNKSPSMAVDVAPWPIDWQNKARFHFMGGLILGLAERLKEEGLIKHKVRWAGDWNQNHDPGDERFYDGPHFELIG